MEPSGGINSLAAIIGSVNSVNPTRNVTDTPLNANLLQRFADNTVLRGTVQQRAPNNVLVLNTQQGILHIQTDIFIKRGAEIAIRIEQRNNENMARLISIDGQSVAKYVESLQGQSPVATLDEVAPTSNFIRPAVTATAPINENGIAEAAFTILRGVFLSTPSLPASRLQTMPPAIQTALSQAYSGTSLEVRILSVQVPTPDGTGFMPLASNNTAVPATASTPLPIMPGGYLSPQSRMLADPSIQSAFQNQQAAQASLPATPATPSAPAIIANPVLSGQTSTSSPIAIPTEKMLPTATSPADKLSGQVTSVSAPSLANNATTLTSGTPASPANANVIAQAVPPATIATTASPASVPVNVNASPIPATPALAPYTESFVTPASSSATAFTASLLPSTNPRELMLQSEFGTLKLFVTSPLPQGSLITFELRQMEQVRGSSAPIPPALAPLPSQFEALGDITHWQHPHLFPHSAPIPHIIPRPGPTLTTEILFLMAALANNDIRRWFGESNSKELETGTRRELLPSLLNEFSILKSIPVEPRDGAWHHMLIPLYHEGAVKPVQLFYKGQRNQDKQKGEKQTDHFMVEIELTRLGKMQLDGLVQKQMQRTQFDLIIRTSTRWDTILEQDIRSIYQRAQEITGFKGSIQFRHGHDAFIVIPVDNPSRPVSNEGSIMV